MEKQPLVAIRCTAYNHEAYIRQALEGFVMQQTNFPFVAIVHDDASTDNTASIIKEFETKYPHIIKPIYEPINTYHTSTFNEIIDNALLSTGAKYIAMCEGDDYWTDPLKLQKQVEFMDAHADYTMCFHNALEKWDFGKNHDKQFSSVKNRDYSGVDIFKDWIVATASVVFKSSILQNDFYLNTLNNPKFMFGDSVLFCTCAKFGKIRGLNDVMSVYRRNRNSVTNSSLSREFRQKIIDFKYEFINVFGEEYRAAATQYCTYAYCGCAIRSLLSGQLDDFRNDLRKAINMSKLKSVKYLIHRLPMIALDKISKHLP